MNDPRVEQILEHIGKVDRQGNPTELALVAARVQAHISAVDELREELEQSEGGIMDVENRAQVLAESLGERSKHRADLQYDAQDTAVRAALSGSSAGAAQLRRQATRKRQNIAEFEKDFAEDQKRLEHAKDTLRSRQSRIKQIRDQIARRMNTVDTLLQRADVAWPAEAGASARRNSGARPVRRAAPRPAARRATRPVTRTSSARRVVVRRRKAS
jgi:chromosome segregation ATPase